MGWSSWRGVAVGMLWVVTVREDNSSMCFQSTPMVTEVRRRMARVRIVTRREEKEVGEASV